MHYLTINLRQVNWKMQRSWWSKQFKTGNVHFCTTCEIIFLVGGPWKSNVVLEKSLKSSWKMIAIFCMNPVTMSPSSGSWNRLFFCVFCHIPLKVKTEKKTWKRIVRWANVDPAENFAATALSISICLFFISYFIIKDLYSCRQRWYWEVKIHRTVSPLKVLWKNICQQVWIFQHYLVLNFTWLHL